MTTDDLARALGRSKSYMYRIIRRGRRNGVLAPDHLIYPAARR